MGRKQAMRSLAAQAKRRADARNRHNRRVSKEAGRQRRKIHQSAEKALKAVEKIQDQLLRDPIKAVNLRFNRESGEICSEEIEIETEYLRTSFEVPSISSSIDDEPFKGPLVEDESFSVEALGYCILKDSFVVALKFEGRDPDYSINLKLFKKSEPAESAAFLVDTEGSHYYYPMATDLKGKVIPGQPRIGLIAFEPIREPTSSLQIHLSDVKLSAVRGKKENLVFEIFQEDMKELLQAAQEADTLVNTLRLQIDEYADSLCEEVDRLAESSKAQPGCLVLLAAPILFGLFLAVSLGMAAVC